MPMLARLTSAAILAGLLGLTTQAAAQKVSLTDLTIDEHPGESCKVGGEVRASAELKCRPGSVTVRTGTVTHIKGEVETEYPDFMTIVYEGEDCAKCIWLQFVWREVLVTKGTGADAKSEALGGTFKAEYKEDGKDLGHTYPLTTDKDKPKWTVDGRHGKDLKPGVSCPACKGKANLTLDQPGAGLGATALDILKEAKSPADAQEILKQYSKLETVLHAATYLVCDKKVCAKITWSISWTFDVTKEGKLKPPTAPVYGIDKDKAVDTSGDSPDPKQLDALKSEYDEATKEALLGK